MKVLEKQLCVEMGQDWIYFEKSGWSLVCSLLLKWIKLQIDSNRSIEIIEPKIRVAKI